MKKQIQSLKKEPIQARPSSCRVNKEKGKSSQVVTNVVTAIESSMVKSANGTQEIKRIL